MTKVISKRWRGIFVTLALAAVVTLALPLQSVRACSVALFDDFNEVTYQPVDENSHWWIRNWGDLKGSNYVWMDVDCGDASCVTAETDSDRTTYVDFALFPDDTPGFYTNAELASLGL